MDRIMTLLFVLLATQLAGQVYVGELLFQNSYTYVEMDCREDSCFWMFPYRFPDRRVLVGNNPLNPGPFSVELEVETLQLTARREGNRLAITDPLSGQTSAFYPRMDNPARLAPYLGVFQDSTGERVVVYPRGERLRLMSPYSEETLTLHRIGEHSFFTASGERFLFFESDPDGFQKVHRIDRSGRKIALLRQPDPLVEDRWIPVGEDTLYARLWLPAEAGPHPACLILPGGGAVGMSNYEYEARILTAYGIACLVFDKPGNGRSRGPGNFRLQSFEEKNRQYVQLFHYLQNLPQTDPQRTGVHGPSEGGRLALMMAIDLADTLAFAISTAAPIMSLRAGQLYALQHYHRSRGVPEVMNLKVSHIWDDYYQDIIAGTIDSSIIDRADRMRTKRTDLFLPPSSTILPGSPRADDLQNDRVAIEAGRIKAPLLLQYGANDQRVDPYRSLGNLRAHLADSIRLSVILYPRGTHSMMTPEGEICPGYAHDKVEWLRTLEILE